MVNFSNDDWLIGLSTFGILLFGYILGSYYFYKSRKLKIRLLTFYSLSQIFVTTAWLAIVIEFFSVLLTSLSINKVLYVYLMWLSAPIGSILLFYITAELLTPKKKWYILIPYLIYMGLTMIGTILNPLGIVIFIEPPQTGFIHKAGLDPANISSFFGLLNFLIILTFGELVYIYKAIKSEGIIRKKFAYLAISFFLLIVFGLFDSFTAGIILVLVRLGAMSSFLFVYLGLREEPEKEIKEKPKKEIKVEGSLFRITKRPEQITEEEVTYYREQKICLICKGKVGGFNTYICTKCDALYHEDCARALSNQENACWACNEPIDKSRPSKPFDLKGEPEKVEKLMKK